MEIPARGVRAQRPRRFMEALPRRQRQCVPEEERDRLQGQRLRWHGPDRVELPVGKRAARFGQRETNEVRSWIPPKRIGLRRPVHVAERGGVPVEVVLCSLVVGHHDLLGRKVRRPRRLRATGLRGSMAVRPFLRRAADESTPWPHTSTRCRAISKSLVQVRVDIERWAAQHAERVVHVAPPPHAVEHAGDPLRIC